MYDQLKEKRYIVCFNKIAKVPQKQTFSVSISIQSQTLHVDGF